MNLDNFGYYLEELAKLNEDLKVQEKGRDVLYKKMTREISSAEDAIRSKYNNSISLAQKKINIFKEQIQEYCDFVEKCCCFDEALIGTILANLLTFFEDEKYVYHCANYRTIIKKDPLITREYEVTKEIGLLVCESAKSDLYIDTYPSELKKLIAANKILVLSYDRFKTKHGISFYKVDCDTERLLQCIDFGRFYYLKEFIDYIIEYRVSYKVVNVSRVDGMG